MDTLNSIPECCAPSCDETITVQVPGPIGPAGSDGSDGSDGVSAFTTLSASFVQPAVNGTVLANMVNGSWAFVGQPIFVEGGGSYEVASITSSTQLVLANLGYSGNASPSDSVPSGSGVSPSGVKGQDGQNGSPANIPLTTKGDLLSRDATTNVRLAVGVNGERLKANSAQTSGLQWAKVDLTASAEVTGALPIANGGSGQITNTLAFNALSPLTTRGDLLVRGVTNNQRLAVGTANTVLKTDGTDQSWSSVNSSMLDSTVARSPVSPALYREEQTSGTAGGTFTAGAWQTRLLSVETYDPGGIGSLASNQVTLAAGTYRFRAMAVGYECDNHQCRLQNITAGTTLAFGSTVRSGAAVEVQVASTIEGRFTIAGATVVELQHRCETTKATSGFGKASSFSNIECYSWIEFEKEAA